MTTRDIYIAIMVASARGKGLRLTADEVDELSRDDAIETHAANCLDSQDWPTHADPCGGPIDWASIDPRRKRVGENLTSVPPETRARELASKALIEKVST